MNDTKWDFFAYHISFLPSENLQWNKVYLRFII